MTTELNLEKLSRLVRATRGSKGLRATAKEIGNVSTSTLSRVENGMMPDMDTFLFLCDWLKVSPAEFFTSDEAVSPTTSSSLSLQIRADRNLPCEVANVLAALVEAAYKDLCIESAYSSE